MNYPPGFPEDLHPPVDQAIAEAEVAFRTSRRNIPRDDYRALQGLALEFMKAVVGAFAEQACEAVRHGTWNGEELRRQVDEFEQQTAHYLKELLADPSETDLDTPWWYEIREQLRQSDKWMAHLEERAQVAKVHLVTETVATPVDLDTPDLDTPDLDTPDGRREAINSYIQQVLAETGKKISRKDIWQHLRYTHATEFERWQRCDKNATKTISERMMNLLKDKPHLVS